MQTPFFWRHGVPLAGLLLAIIVLAAAQSEATEPGLSLDLTPDDVIVQREAVFDQLNGRLAVVTSYFDGEEMALHDRLGLSGGLFPPTMYFHEDLLSPLGLADPGECKRGGYPDADAARREREREYRRIAESSGIPPLGTAPIGPRDVPAGVPSAFRLASPSSDPMALYAAAASGFLPIMTMATGKFHESPQNRHVINSENILGMSGFPAATGQRMASCYPYFNNLPNSNLPFDQMAPIPIPDSLRRIFGDFRMYPVGRDHLEDGSCVSLGVGAGEVNAGKVVAGPFANLLATYGDGPFSALATVGVGAGYNLRGGGYQGSWGATASCAYNFNNGNGAAVGDIMATVTVDPLDGFTASVSANIPLDRIGKFFRNLGW